MKEAEEKKYTENDLRRIFAIGQYTKNYGDYKPYTFEEAFYSLLKEKESTKK